MSFVRRLRSSENVFKSVACAQHRATTWPHSATILPYYRCNIVAAMPCRNGQSTVGGPKWTKIRPKWTKMHHLGPFWSRECQNPVRNKAILTKMVVWTILDHFGPVRFPTVPRPLPRCLVDPSLLKLRSLDSSFPFRLSDHTLGDNPESPKLS